MRVSDGLWRQAGSNPDKVALVSGEQRWTYRELQTEIAGLGAGLHQMGLRRCDRLALCLPNCAEYLMLFLAAARYGMVAMTVPEGTSGAELGSILQQSRPAAIASTPEWVQARRPCISEPLLTPADCRERIAAARASGWAEPALAGADDPFYIGFTSGSTGRPKGVVRQHGAWVRTFAAATAAFGLTPEERFLVPGPLHFSASLFAALHILEIGGTLFLERRFSPRRVTALLAEQQVTGAFMVPTLYQSLADEISLAYGSVNCLISCGEKLRPGLRQALGTRFPNARVYEYYGSSEAGFITVHQPEGVDRAESVGIVFPGVAVAIRRPDGTAAAPGETGVLYVKSDMAAAGFLREDGTVTPIAHHDGWIATGDLARVERDGFIYLEGRADGAITSGGATVFPAEIEAVLAAHPAVAEVAVVGRVHPKRGEEIVAAVVLQKGARVRKAELRAACAAGLAPFKRPRTLVILPDLPHTATGKISRRKLQALLSETAAK